MNRIKTIIILLVFTVCFSAEASAQSEKMSLVTTSKYFTVYAYPGFDPNSFVRKINYNYLSSPDTVLDGLGPGQMGILGNTLDALYLEVSDILDLHSYNFHGKLKIVSDQNQVNLAFKRIYGKSFPERSVFVLDENTIYISEQDVTLGMLGHEMAHAIICHFFVVPPPAKTQEVLAGYVEYSLRKKTGTLPVSF